MRATIPFFVFISLLVGCTAHKEQTNWQEVFSSTLFHDVQMAAVFPDSKTFADCTPKTSWHDAIQAYEKEKNKPGFDLTAFVQEHFTMPDRPITGFVSDTTANLDLHIQKLWPVLTRMADKEDYRSSRIPLPYPYVVPGGRFSEIYYWDSYFTMLGLLVHNREKDVVNMLDNFAWMIKKFGHIPNGSRTYYLSRSQPPFFACMIALLQQRDSTALLRYLPALQKEYQFWMEGETRLQMPGNAHRRVVMMPDGSVLNRYWDDVEQPRPEAYREDVNLALRAERPAEELYRNLRAAAESGWDFSSRWLDDTARLETIRTTEIIPVDLNSLLYFTERTLQQGYQQKKLQDSAAYFAQRADSRRRAILTFFWNEQAGFFTDYDWAATRQREQVTLAGVYPLFFGLAQPQMANRMATVIEKYFLKPGGLTTTLVESGQQWDAPNGWAPLHYLTISGLQQYGHQHLAAVITKRWLNQTQRVFRQTGKMMEKYNVTDTTKQGGGGEYPNQDGFGWTNGVVAFLLNRNSFSEIKN